MSNIRAETMKKLPPGIMFYFDLRTQTPFYNDAELGQILKSALEYGATGILPEFEDRSMIVLWENIREKIDRDRVHYWETVEDRSYAAYCKKAKKKGVEAMSREEWDEMNARQEEKTQSDRPPDWDRIRDEATRSF